ncbi:helix-turn-helix domain-containing protein [Pseudonocardia sp. DLS-67]
MWIRDGPSGSARALRAQIVLLSRDGYGATAIADRLGCSRQTVVTWRERYRLNGVLGLSDGPRSGRPITVDATAVVARTLCPPPAGAQRWSTRLLAKELGISNAAVANVWRSWGIIPWLEGGLHLVTEPVLDAPITDVAGLHVDPPLRLLAVLTGAAQPRGGDPGVHLAALGGRLSDLERLPAAGPDRAALTRFLARLEQYDDGTPRLRLVVAGDHQPVRDWVASRRVGIHLVPEAGSWARLAQVACLLAAMSRPRAGSMAALDDDLDHHTWQSPVSWLFDG